MAVNDLHLAVEIGAWWTTAFYQQSGATHPVYFDGQPRLPSGVCPDPDTGILLTGTPALVAGMSSPPSYRPDPMALLHAGAHSDDGVDPLAAVAAVLAHVANIAAGQAGSRVAALTVVTASAWGPRARQRLQQAATSAGLPDPHIVTAAAAAARHAHQPDSGGTSGFVVTANAALELTVLDCADRFQQLAHATVHDPSARSIDERLLQAAAERVAADLDVASGGWQIKREVHQARAALVVQPRVSLLLPEPLPPVALSRMDVSVAAAPHLAQLDDNVKQLLTEADLGTSDIATVVLAGHDAVIPELAARLERTGLPTAVTLADAHAIPRGALQLTQPLSTGSHRTAATARLPRTRLTLANLARIAVLAACSVALLLQTITTADTWTRATTVTDVRLSVENLGLAAALAALTAWAAAQLAPTRWISAAHADDEITTGTLLRRGYLGAAALGLAVAGLWGLGTSVGVRYTDEAYLRAALTTAAPIAASAALIAITAPRLPTPTLPSWLQRASPPVLAIALAAIGVFLQRAALTLTFPVDLLSGMAGLVQSVGAALLGVATALTATRQPLLRVIAAVILGTGYALVTSVTTSGYLTIAYLAVLIWWALATAATTIITITPQAAAWLTRWHTASAEPPSPASQAPGSQ